MESTKNSINGETLVSFLQKLKSCFELITPASQNLGHGNLLPRVTDQARIATWGNMLYAYSGSD
jgi:hypothetical protein